MSHGSNYGTDGSPLKDLPDFSMKGDKHTFKPKYYPEKVNPTKKRNIKREDGLCENESVSDNGSKNIDISVRGYLLEPHRSVFWSVMHTGGQYKMSAQPWSGHVYIEDGDLRGPIGVDDHYNEWVYEYTFQLVESNGSKDDEDDILKKANDDNGSDN